MRGVWLDVSDTRIAVSGSAFEGQAKELVSPQRRSQDGG